MIELITGLPGSGKTLSRVQWLAKMQAKWEKNPDEARSVFCHNITGLKLPHSPLPLLSIRSKSGDETKVPDWNEIPEGSLIIIDECQCFFPPRSSQSTAPEHVAFLNTHRHKGFDIVLVTQHPKLIDTSVRALVGKHQHYRRVFGGKRSICYEFDGSNDSLGNLKNAVTSYFSFPHDAYKWYVSAETHTKQNFKYPAWLLIPVLGILLAIFFIPRAYAVFTKSQSNKGLGDVAKIEEKKFPVAASGVPVAPPLHFLPSQMVPQVDPNNAFVREPIFAMACISSSKSCRCYGHGNIHVKNIPDDVCRAAASAPYDFTNFKG